MKKRSISVLLALTLTAAGCSTAEETPEQTEGSSHTEHETAESSTETSEIELMHVHGLGVSNADGAIYVPAHDGLKMFKDGQWSEAAGEKHDYMGFVMTEDGFYSSGHPARGSDLANPFGIVKSEDMGESLEMLDLYKEIDFHLMAVGYNSKTIYVMNPATNSRMNETGLHYSTDDTKTWTKSAAQGLEGELITLAAHPENEAVAAAGTDQGLFVSEDYGQSFRSLSAEPATSVTFSTDGTLLAGTVGDSFTLSSFNLETGEQTALPIPELTGQNAISNIAVNPQHTNQIVFATFEKDLYLSEDNGESWAQIANKGIGINIQ